MNLADKYLKPLTEVQRDLKRKVSDAEWDGDLGKASFLTAQLSRVEDRIADGEVYEVLF